jgi:hypothetical protein
MVDVNKIRSLMALLGYTQKTLAVEMSKRGKKISENTLSAKMTGSSKFDCEDADVICDILNVKSSAEKAEIFLA